MAKRNSGQPVDIHRNDRQANGTSGRSVQLRPDQPKTIATFRQAEASFDLDAVNGVLVYDLSIFSRILLWSTKRRPREPDSLRLTVFQILAVPVDFVC